MVVDGAWSLTPPLSFDVVGVVDDDDRHADDVRSSEMRAALQPLSETGPTDTLLEDLAVVCANCHAMIHRGGECRPIASLISERRAEE